MKNLLITGSGGFVGKNMKEYFAGKYNLLTPRSYELNLIETKAVESFFANNQIDLIIHCGSVGGARGVKDGSSTIDDNLKMVDNILAYKNLETKVILFGSGAMYDKSKPIKKAKESEIGKIKPYDLYGESKVLISQRVRGRKDCVCLNIFGCYGKGEKDSRFPTYAIMQNLKQESITINQNVVFDYLYIDDLARIIEYFLVNTPKENVINVTPSKSISLIEIANIVNEISEYKSDILISNKDLGNEYTGDNSRLLSEIPDFSFTPYGTGLKLLYEFLKREMSINNSAVI